MTTVTDYDFLYKILLIGDVRVGKTSFLTKYVKNTINRNQAPTLGVEYQTQNIVLQDGTIIKAQMWDTSGSEKYKSITTAHYRKSVGALLFYDLTDKTSFENAADWLREIHDHTEEGIVIMLIGNKYDLVLEDPSARKVSTEEATNFVKKYHLLYMETSAKTGYNVKEAFETLVETVYEEQQRNQQGNSMEYARQIKLKKDGGQNKTEDSSQKSGCCN